MCRGPHVAGYDIEVNLGDPSVSELKTSPKTRQIETENPNLPAWSDKKSHGQGTQRESCKTMCPICDDLGLKSPVIKMSFQTKPGATSTGAQQLSPYHERTVR